MKVNKTFVIRHKETKEIWRAPSGKTSWREKGHAKNAWGTLCGYYYNDCYLIEQCKKFGVSVVEMPSFYGVRKSFPKFDEQTTWEIVELKHDSEDRLQQATKLLQFAVGRLTDYHFEEKVKQFLEENNNNEH